MTQFNAKLAEVVGRDSRYAYEAYEFVFLALAFTQQRLGRDPKKDAGDAQTNPDHHVSGPELLDGLRLLALREFGLMARIVFGQWGIRRTDDFGEIVFNLIEAGLMSKTEGDTRADFRGVFDLDAALVHDYRIPLDEAKRCQDPFPPA